MKELFFVLWIYFLGICLGGWAVWVYYHEEDPVIESLAQEYYRGYYEGRESCIEEAKILIQTKAETVRREGVEAYNKGFEDGHECGRDLGCDY